MARIGSAEVEQELLSSEEESSFSFLFFLARRWRLILGLTGIATILSLVVSFLLPNQYTAEMILMPPTQSSSLSSALLSQVGGGASPALASLAGASLGIRNPGETYVSLFRTHALEEAVVQRFQLMKRYKVNKMSDACKQFEKRSMVTLGVKDGLIRIAVEDRDPDMAAQIANGYVDEFRKQSANLAISEASQRRLFFEQQLDDAKNKLKEAEVAMEGTQQSAGISKSKFNQCSRTRLQAILTSF